MNVNPLYGTALVRSALFNPTQYLPKKAPDAFISVSVDVSSGLAAAGLCAEDVAAMNLSSEPSGDGELWASFLSLTGSTVTWWVACGVAGRQRPYLLSLLCGAANGATVQFTYAMPIDPTFAVPPIPSPVNAGFGLPITWSRGQHMFGPVLNLPPATVEATGTTQITAAIVPLAKVLVNAAQAANAGIILPQASTFCGNTLPVVNVSGVPISIYPYSGDAISTNAVNAAVTIENLSSASFWVAQSGILVVS